MSCFTHHHLVHVFLERLLSYSNQSTHRHTVFFCFGIFYVCFYTFSIHITEGLTYFVPSSSSAFISLEAAAIAAVTLQVKWQAGSSEIALALCKQLLGEHKDTVHSMYLFPQSQNIFCMIALFPAGLRTGSPKAAPITVLVG